MFSFFHAAVAQKPGEAARFRRTGRGRRQEAGLFPAGQLGGLAQAQDEAAVRAHRRECSLSYFHFFLSFFFSSFLRS